MVFSINGIDSFWSSADMYGKDFILKIYGSIKCYFKVKSLNSCLLSQQHLMKQNAPNIWITKVSFHLQGNLSKQDNLRKYIKGIKSIRVFGKERKMVFTYFFYTKQYELFYWKPKRDLLIIKKFNNNNNNNFASPITINLYIAIRHSLFWLS